MNRRPSRMASSSSLRITGQHGTSSPLLGTIFCVPPRRFGNVRYDADFAQRHRGALAWLARSYLKLGELYEARGNRGKAVDYYGRLVELWRGRTRRSRGW